MTITDYLYTPAPPEGAYCFTSVRPSVLPSVCPSVRPKIFFVAFFSATIDGRNLIFGHKLHIGTPYSGKCFWTGHIPTSCLRGYHKWALAHNSSCLSWLGPFLFLLYLQCTLIMSLLQCKILQQNQKQLHNFTGKSWNKCLQIIFKDAFVYVRAILLLFPMSSFTNRELFSDITSFI